MASDVSGRTSYTSKERELVKLQAEVVLQEEITRLAQKRFAIKALEAEIQSTFNRSVRPCDMRSPEIQSPPMKIHKAGNGGGGPPDDDPDGNDVSPGHESCPPTVYKPSPSPSPAAPIIEEASTTTTRIELPVSTLNEESLIRLQLFPPQTQEFSIHTPAMSSVDPTLNAEKMLAAQQEFLQEEADAERIRPMQRELILDQERNKIGAVQERLRIVAGKVQKQSGFNALNIAMAEQRIRDEEFKADAEYRAAENKTRSTELNLQEEAENARKGIRAEEAAQRLRAIEVERQHELNIKEANEQKLRDESIARNMQQKLIELEHQLRATTEALVNLSELKQREIALKEECAYKDRLRTQFKEEERRVRALAESMVIEKENKVQIAFDEKYQSQFNVMQAELTNQFAMLQSAREKMKQHWYNFTNSKDNEIEILKLKLLEAQKALDKVSRLGSSHDMPVNAVSAMGTVTKIITETIREENDPKPPNRPGGHGGGGGDGGYPGDPSDPGRARQPAGNENKKSNPGSPGGPNDPNPPGDPWGAYSSAPESLRALIEGTKNNKEAEKITVPTLPKAHMFRPWKLIVRKTTYS